MNTSSIDDLLMGIGVDQDVNLDESQSKEQEEGLSSQEEHEFQDDYEHETEQNEEEEETEEHETDNDESIASDKVPDSYEDEYGNKKDRMSKGMKDRLDRKEKQYQREVQQREEEIQQLRAQIAQATSNQQVNQAAKDFVYDAESAVSVEAQLSEYIRREVNAAKTYDAEHQEKQREAEAQRVFEDKFKRGMNNLDDFREVIGALPFAISNPMTLATRSLDNPAAFLYAAAKRHPQELERIAKIRDPYGQMMEMGRLEERMRKTKAVTNAPRPLRRVAPDHVAKTTTQKDYSGDELLAQSDAQRIAVTKRMRNNR